MCLKNFHKTFVLLFLALLFTSCARENIKQKTEEENAIQKSTEMYHSPNWIVRLEGITALRKPPYKDAWHPNSKKRIITFLKGATEDIHTAVKIEAIKQLALYIDDAGVIKYLEEISLNDENNNIRWAALESLLQSPSRETIKVFMTNFTSDDIFIKETSIKGILKLNDDSSKQDALPYVLDALNDEAINVRIAALDNLTFRDEAIYRILAESFQKDRLSATMLHFSLKAIDGYKLDQETQEKIVPFLTHTDVEIRILALRALKSSDRIK
ncbi:MAG: HEAT repeat domain-containing protein [Leptospirales bacterium]|nr:HEAT repeat domain-containing protein [Leptospirales bacterium]